jgi:biotin transport system substrate-specific component
MIDGVATSRPPSLLSVLWPRTGAAVPRRIAAIVLDSLTLTVSAKVQIPFWPVPMTLQSLVILLIGLGYGWRLGTATVLLYLGEGAVGLPVFAGTPERGIGLVYMAGPTGGYLIGFLLATAALGWLAERGWDRSLACTGAAMAVGHIILFVPGVLWLAVLVGFEQAVRTGVEPFVAATLVKTALGVAIMSVAWGAARRRPVGSG